ncbi:RxLR effector protein [Phytophthora megakarya]|uniref:RxLR effector protein n=1 Tax=Phytophthora megakarya TaxID=4795 RepID=A0A225WQR8_9STRA|nr:RxLR effector protein [Phytophthora megakarya]
MRLVYILLAVVSTLCVYQVPVAASVGNEAALTGVMSLGFLHLIGADQSVSDQSRFLRSNLNTEGSKEERGLYDLFQIWLTKRLVDKMAKDKDSSLLGKWWVQWLVNADHAVDEADNKLAAAYKAVKDKNMKPSDLAAKLREDPTVDDETLALALGWYRNYLKSEPN